MPLPEDERRKEAAICAKCRRAADPDTDLLVVVLGVPMCAACANEEADG